MAGIVGYGAFIPGMRIKASEFKSAWGSFLAPGIAEKAVADVDDDSLTMAVNAAFQALERAGIQGKDLRTVALASSALPYEVRFQVGTLCKAVGAPDECLGLQFVGSSKSGTEALVCALSAVRGRGEFSLVAVGDCRSSSIFSPLEHGFGAAGCALVLGDHGVVAEIEASAHYVDDIPGDRFRPVGQGDIVDVEVKAYTDRYVLRAVTSAARELFKVTCLRPADFRHLAISQPDGRFAPVVARTLGLSDESVKHTNMAVRLGDTGACSAMLGMIAGLERSEEGDRLLVISYGEGGGADAVSLRVLVQPRVTGFDSVREDVRYIDFLTYLKLRRRVL